MLAAVLFLCLADSPPRYDGASRAAVYEWRADPESPNCPDLYADGEKIGWMKYDRYWDLRKQDYGRCPAPPPPKCLDPFAPDRSHSVSPGSRP